MRVRAHRYFSQLLCWNSHYLLLLTTRTITNSRTLLVSPSVAPPPPPQCPSQPRLLLPNLSIEPFYPSPKTHILTCQTHLIVPDVRPSLLFFASAHPANIRLLLRLQSSHIPNLPPQIDSRISLANPGYRTATRNYYSSNARREKVIAGLRMSLYLVERETPVIEMTEKSR